MGIFGNKQQNDQSQVQPMTIPDTATGAPSITGSIDGVIPTYQDPTPAPPTPDPTNIGAPPVSTHAANPVGDYIMTDPPVTSGQGWDEPAHQHDIDEATSAPQATPAPINEPNETPQVETSAVDPFEAARSVPSTHPLTVSSTDTPEDLAAIKEKALRDLSPLVSHLDLSPEEKFHTAMMMLQATDDQSLVKQAYEAAQAITDEKTRAQALLDIVNEINYFTQHKL